MGGKVSNFIKRLPNSSCLYYNFEINILYLNSLILKYLDHEKNYIFLFFIFYPTGIPAK